MIKTGSLGASERAEDTRLIDKDILSLQVELEKNLMNIYSKIILEELYFNRGDVK